jgi:hypothetical protein
LTTSGASDVDAAGILAGEGGVTIAPNCEGAGCQIATDCASGSATTLTGTVYDPAGNNPVYNATVYVPLDAVDPLPSFPSGASCGTCANAPSLAAVAVAQTGPDGKFALINVPSTDVAPGNPIPLVVEVGKWRREVLLTSVPKCQTTAVDPSNSRLPRNQTDGAGGKADIPRIAIAQGNDPVECTLLKMGIDPAEFQAPGPGTRRIDYYTGWSQTNHVVPASLVGSTATLMNYDVVILPCEGGVQVAGQTTEDDANNQYADNVSAYANAGGRLLTSHFGYTWLATPTASMSGGPSTANPVNPATNNPNPFYSVANWDLNDHSVTPSTSANIVTTLPDGGSFPKGQALATWALNAQAATDGGTLTIAQNQLHTDIASVNAPTTTWIQETSPNTQPYVLSFDTPVGGGADGGAGMCGRVEYTEFHVPQADRVDQNTDGQCTSNADCGFTSTCIQGTPGTCVPQTCATDSDCSFGHCVGSTLGQCVAQNCTVATEATDCSGQPCVQGTCSCTNESQCASASCVGAPNGRCGGSPQACGYDDDCGSVERCSGAILGTCQKACSVDANCGFGQKCVSGVCQQGCFIDWTCPSSNCNTGKVSVCSASSTSFPLSCKQAPMSPEEYALEFLLLDLTACISPDSVPPPPPSVSEYPGPGSAGSVSGDAGSVDGDAGPVSGDAGAADGEAGFPLYSAATFTEDFTANCPQGTHVVWRELDWQASIPNTASIVFSAQSANTAADGGLPDYSGTTPTLLVTATASTMPPTAYIDTGTTGAFNTAVPPVLSRDALRLTVTLNPTMDGMAAPVLQAWQVKADCLPAE